MRVEVVNRQKDVPIKAASVRRLVKEVLKGEHVESDEVSIHFVTTAEISRLHQKFFNDPTPTDCISFPLDQEPTTDYHILGEVFVCPQTAIDYCLSQGKQEQVYLETSLYVVHGLLHLIGYDDTKPAARKKMELAQNTHLQALTRKNLLLSAL